LQFSFNAESNSRFCDASDLEVAHKLLIADEKLSVNYFDDSLTGDWKDPRDYDIKSDIALIYKGSYENTLQLVRKGTHSELGI
jgi:mRNA interferase YafQ